MKQKPAHMKRRMVSMRLPEWLITWMLNQPGSQSMIVENAIKKNHNISEELQ